jgi:hypothetical protein
MMGMTEARKLLSDALRQYSAADTEAKMERAVLALHTALEDALRAHLTRMGYSEADDRQIGFPELVDLIAEHTGLFEGDLRVVRLLKSLNKTRTKIAHPRGDKPSPQQIANDAQQLTKLIRHFWPGWFGEICPHPTVAPRPSSAPKFEQPPRPPSMRPETQQPPSFPWMRPETEQPPRFRPMGPETQQPPRFSSMGPETEQLPRSPSVRPETQQPSPPSERSRFLRSLWSDESEPRFQVKLFLKRLVGIFILLTTSRWCKNAAIYTARWPEPIKYGGIALFLVAVGLFVWGVVVIWRLVRQLRLRGILVLVSVSSLLLITISVLTSESSLPIQQEALSITRRLLISSGHKARSMLMALVEAPGDFRFAYTGRRRPLQMQDGDVEESSLLTPIPANYAGQPESIAEPSVSPPKASGTGTVRTPSPVSVPTTPSTDLLLPGCPHPQARLTAPRVNQVVKEQIRAEGTANIEDFDYYKFEIRREDGDVEDEWHWIGGSETSVENGTLGDLNVSGLPEGVYTFRLMVVNREGNYPFPPCEVRIRVEH